MRLPALRQVDDARDRPARARADDRVAPVAREGDAAADALAELELEAGAAGGGVEGDEARVGVLAGAFLPFFGLRRAVGSPTVTTRASGPDGENTTPVAPASVDLAGQPAAGEVEQADPLGVEQDDAAGAVGRERERGRPGAAELDRAA